MFNMDIGEVLIVLLVAFLVVGPKDLPRVAKWLARQFKSIKRIIREIKKETGWDEFAKELRDTADDVRSTVQDADVSKELRDAAENVSLEMNAAGETLKTSLEQKK